MAVSAKIVVVAAFSLIVIGGAKAQQAQTAAATAAPEHCEGTLCDLYYANRGNAPDASAAKPATTTSAATTPGVPAGATALTAPTGNPFSRLFSGGSSSPGGTSNRPPPPPSEPATASNSYMHMGTGGVLGDSERCSGTMCDLFYGSSPAEPATGQQQAAAGVAADASPGEPQVPHRHIAHESETRPKCSSPNADPWRCYR